MIVLDTQVLVWLTTDKQKLSTPAAHAIREASTVGGGLAIAGHTLWEIAMISTRRRIRLPSSLSEYLHYLESALTVLPITGEIAERAWRFPKQYPKDPADRLIGATALVHGLRLVTKDEGIRSSGEVDCVW